MSDGKLCIYFFCDNVEEADRLIWAREWLSPAGATLAVALPDSSYTGVYGLPYLDTTLAGLSAEVQVLDVEEVIRVLTLVISFDEFLEHVSAASAPTTGGVDGVLHAIHAICGTYFPRIAFADMLAPEQVDVFARSVARDAFRMDADRVWREEFAVLYLDGALAADLPRQAQPSGREDLRTADGAFFLGPKLDIWTGDA